MKFKLVIFDFDGTLADSLDCFVGALNECAGRHGFRTLAPDELDMVRGFGSRELMRHLGIPPWKSLRIAADMRRLMHARLDEVALFPGMPAVLAQLSAAGVALAIVTSNSEATVRRVLGPEQVRLIECFSCGVSLFGKRARFEKLRVAGGYARGDVLCIGDEIRDADAARAAGLAFAGVAWGYALPAALQPHSPLPLLQRVEELPGLVL